MSSHESMFKKKKKKSEPSQALKVLKADIIRFLGKNMF